jgi:hypothetical protein
LPADSNGSPGGATTYLTSPHLVGKTLPRASVRLLNASGTVVNTTQANSAGGYEVQVPGALAIGLHVFRVQVVDQYGDVSSPSAARTITLVSPPPVVTIIRVTEDTNKRHQVTEVLVTFSGPVETALAKRISTYHLATPGNGGSYTATNAGVIKLRSASYNPASDTVALRPRKPFALTKPVQLLVYGSGPHGLKDYYGRYVHGGTNPVAVISGRGATIKGIVQPLERGKMVARAVVIDALVVRNELAGVDARRRSEPSRDGCSEA